MLGKGIGHLKIHFEKKRRYNMFAIGEVTAVFSLENRSLWVGGQFSLLSVAEWHVERKQIHAKG
jgi:hypothetical protein